MSLCCCCSFSWIELLRLDFEQIGILVLRLVGRISQWLSESLVAGKVILLMTWVTSVPLLVGSLAGIVLWTGERPVSRLNKLLTAMLLLTPLTWLGVREKWLRIGLVVWGYERRLVRLKILKIEILGCKRNLGGLVNKLGTICTQLWSLNLDWRRSDWLCCDWL